VPKDLKKAGASSSDEEDEEEDDEEEKDGEEKYIVNGLFGVEDNSSTVRVILKT
jgi:hypothetical protein